jgi:hypothetical protein
MQSDISERKEIKTKALNSAGDGSHAPDILTVSASAGFFLF